MKHLKLVSKGFEDYTGNFGPVPFVNGLSVEPVPELFARRVAAATQVVWVNDDGSEEDASVAHALIAAAELRAPVVEELPRQTEADKKAEQRAKILKSVDAESAPIYSRTELEAVVQKDGVKALRAVGDKWGVKHKQAIALIELILEAQSKFIEARNAKLQAAGVAEEPEENADVADHDGEPADPGVDGASVGGEEAPAGEGEPAPAEGAVEAEAPGAAEGLAQDADEGASVTEPKAE